MSHHTHVILQTSNCLHWSRDTRVHHCHSFYDQIAECGTGAYGEVCVLCPSSVFVRENRYMCGEELSEDRLWLSTQDPMTLLLDVGLPSLSQHKGRVALQCEVAVRCVPSPSGYDDYSDMDTGIKNTPELQPFVDVWRSCATTLQNGARESRAALACGHSVPMTLPAGWTGARRAT